MAAAARKLSQVVTHMVIGFTITYVVTGSAMSGGLAVLVESVINVLLTPVHEKIWMRFRSRQVCGQYLGIAAEKFSQAGLHMGVAFGVMYVATGSVVAGGVAALLEPICNVILMPLHDRLWDNARPAGLAHAA
jgi:uncharacterized membrane protein